ncbi:MAG TPA: hypothetical protein PLQ56_27350 [Aggregatilineales bacterium]|nr:hypothetical protein [Aggregatilineales bacterium]
MSIEITLKREAVNLEALQEELSAIAGQTVPVRYAAGEVSISLPDTLRENQVNQARRAILQHDPDQLTARQQAALERQLQREQARRELKGVELDLKAFDEKDEALRLLARKIAWLERELALLTE